MTSLWRATSPTLVVPRISAGTLNAWEAAQHRLGEYLSLDKISKADGLNVTSVLELSGVRDRFLVGCENCASHLIPDLSLIKNKVQRVGRRLGKTGPSPASAAHLPRT